MGYEHFLLVGHGAFVVPLWHSVVEVILVDDFERMFGCCLGIHHGFDEGVAGKAVAAMKAGA